MGQTVSHYGILSRIGGGDTTSWEAYLSALAQAAVE